MMNNLQDRPVLGTGIYTVPDISLILGLPYAKVNRWINKVWNEKLSSIHGLPYYWTIDLTKAVNFQTLVEINTFYHLSQAGVPTKELRRVHNILAEQFNTLYPFARKDIIEHLRTDGRKVLFEYSTNVICTLDVTRQFKLGFIRDFFKNLDFGANDIATRLWPIGKERRIVCDPHHQFGQPILSGTNIFASTIFRLYRAGETKDFIRELYQVDNQAVEDAIIFFDKAA